MDLPDARPAGGRDLAAEILRGGIDAADVLEAVAAALRIGDGSHHGHGIAEPVPLSDRIARYLQMRRRRDAIFGEGLFHDPVWDMLLDLYVARAARRPVSVSSCCIAAAVAPTTALRWLSELEARGIVFRTDDELDRRRSFVHLAPGTVEMIEAVWAHA